MLGTFYMSGQFYFVSMGLTPYIDVTARKRNPFPHVPGMKFEDFNTGYTLLHTYHHTPIHTVVMNGARFLMHPLKKEKEFRNHHNLVVHSNFTHQLEEKWLPADGNIQQYIKYVMKE
jgi:hypothetical protein